LTGSTDCRIRVFAVDRLLQIAAKAQSGDVRYNAGDALMRTFEQGQTGVSHLCTLSQLTFLSAGFNKSISIWDVRQPKCTKLLQDASRCKLTAVRKFNSAETFLTASEDGLVNVSLLSS